MKPAMTHGDLVAQCLNELAAAGCMVWQNNTGAAKTGTRFVRYGLAGSSDIIGLTSRGRFVAVECKIRTDRLTEEQRKFRDCVLSRNAIYAVVRWTDKHGITGMSEVIQEVKSWPA